MRFGLAIVMLLVVLRLFSGCGQNTEKHGEAPPVNGDENQKPPPDSHKPPPDTQKPPDPPPPENPLELSFKNLSKRVFAVSCYECHNRKQEITQGQIGLDTYSEVKDNSARIYLETIITRRMPLQGMLTQEQYDLLKAWLEADAPEQQTGMEFTHYGEKPKKAKDD